MPGYSFVMGNITANNSIDNNNNSNTCKLATYSKIILQVCMTLHVHMYVSCVYVVACKPPLNV